MHWWAICRSTINSAFPTLSCDLYGLLYVALAVRLHSLVFSPQAVYPPVHAAMYKLFTEQEGERVRLASAHLAEKVGQL